MNESQLPNHTVAIDRAIALVEAALRECDEQGYMYAAIDISSALDKLKELKTASAPARPR